MKTEILHVVHVQSCPIMSAKNSCFPESCSQLLLPLSVSGKKNPQIVSSWCDVYCKNKETEKRLKAHMEYKVPQSPA